MLPANLFGRRVARTVHRPDLHVANELDRRHIGLARETEPRFDLLIPPATEALLLVEQEGNDTAEVRERLRPEGITPGNLDAPAFTEFVAAEIRRWTPVIRASGARVD